MHNLLHQLIKAAADRDPDATAVAYKADSLTYGELWEKVGRATGGLTALGLTPGARVGLYLEKRLETVIAIFAVSLAGAVFVPINPQLRARQVGHILRDCEVSILLTSRERLHGLGDLRSTAPALQRAILVDDAEAAQAASVPVAAWGEVKQGHDASSYVPARVIDNDIAAILYTSGSTGAPKGVVLSHRNLVCGAKTVSGYLENRVTDRILAVLPLSFDAGFSQLTTAFCAGACVVLMNYLLPKGVIDIAAKQRITGLTCVAPLWIQLALQDWPPEVASRLRYFANTGGHLPRAVLEKLRQSLPKAKPYLMYGLTEAFRSTYLDPAEIDRRPGSIGKAIPNEQVLVVGPDGHLCGPGEEGELVHRGALVSMGYWNDPERTEMRFRPAPGRATGLVLPEIAVWSGDIVKTDEDGFLYFVRRQDDMIKTSGYRVSPTEIEEVIHETGLVGEAAAIGVPNETLGQAILLVCTPPPGQALDTQGLLQACRQQLPNYMIPIAIEQRDALPKTANGKIDRRLLVDELAERYGDVMS